jgi:hypothetical protein
MVTVITTTATSESASAESDGDALWLDVTDLERITGYELKPEGFCRDEVCVPVPVGRESEFLRDGAGGPSINLAAFWRHLDAAIVHDEDGQAWSLGEPPDDRGARLQSLQAPDFTLPDVGGTPHSLSDYRGQKVLLAAWASW